MILKCHAGLQFCTFSKCNFDVQSRNTVLKGILELGFRMQSDNMLEGRFGNAVLVCKAEAHFPKAILECGFRAQNGNAVFE